MDDEQKICTYVGTNCTEFSDLHVCTAESAKEESECNTKPKNKSQPINLTMSDLCSIYSVLNLKTFDRSKCIRLYLYIEVAILTFLVYVISSLAPVFLKLIFLAICLFFILFSLFIVNSLFTSLIRDYISLYKVEILLGLTKKLPELEKFKPNDAIIDKKYIDFFESGENIISKIKRKNGEYIFSLIWHIFLIAVLIILIVYNATR